MEFPDLGNVCCLPPVFPVFSLLFSLVMKKRKISGKLFGNDGPFSRGLFYHHPLLFRIQPRKTVEGGKSETVFKHTIRLYA